MANWWTVTHENTWERTKRTYHVNIPMAHINTLELAREWLGRELSAEGHRKLWDVGSNQIDDGKGGDNTWRIEPCAAPPVPVVTEQQPTEPWPAVLLVVLIMIVVSITMAQLAEGMIHVSR